MGQKIYLVHRLDKETSGLLVCAKNPRAAAKWTRILGEKSAEKEYMALCFGEMKNPRGKISSDIVERGVKKRAETFYETEKVFEIPWEDFEKRGEENFENSAKENSFEKKFVAQNFAENSGRENSRKESHENSFCNRAQNFAEKKSEKIAAKNSCADSESSAGVLPRKMSLLRLRLGTGRTHQLRIHLAAEGVPICGDDKHGDFAANRLLKKKFGIKRLCLCAFRLTLPLAEGRRTVEIDAGFSSRLEAILAKA
ncbi:MAG: RNA pseudouridine synthase [Treponemataceae bacterium]|nr:RNA pseudouridine synthase [Treponemataceae bacterium]